jgi:hypothetical protein
MADVIFFTPVVELDVTANHKWFVEIARTQLKTIREDLVFEENIWTYSGAKRKRRIRFGTTASTKKGMRDVHMEPFQEPFLSFSKAYIRYLQAHEPVSTPETFRLLVLRRVYDALLDVIGSADVSLLTPIVMDMAVAAVKSAYAESSMSTYGYEMQKLCQFLQDKCLVYIPFTWRNPIKHGDEYQRVGEDFEVRRREKLPSPTALAALAHVYRVSTRPDEVLASCIGGLLCCAPAHICEVLGLEAFPEHTERASNGSVKFGLRWRPAKGGKPQIKWIPTPMVELAKEALGRIREITSNARKIAKWYEENPNCIYLPGPLEYLRHEPYVDTGEVAKILWGESIDGTRTGAASQWLKENSIEVVRGRKRLLAAFDQVEKKVLSLLPHTFPLIDTRRGVKYSDALFVTLRNTLRPDSSEIQCLVEALSDTFISGRFGGKPNISIFLAHQLYEDDGTPIHLTSKQCRHYLNMAGQTNNMSQLDIALWSGRKLVRQNSAYDHVSGRDLAMRANEIMHGESEAQTPSVLKKPRYLVARSDFMLQLGTNAHTTEFGHCIHDYAMLPCTRFRDCLNCDEHVCVKGNVTKESALRRHLAETRNLLELARMSHAEGNFGADHWVEHQEKTVERIEQLIAIIDDPRVPSGSVVLPRALPGTSRVEQTAWRRAVAIGETGHVSGTLPGKNGLETVSMLLTHDDAGEEA